MTYAPPQENTLGVILGHGRRREADATRRVIRAATPQRSSLGTGFLGIGAAVVVGLRSIYGVATFTGLWASGVYPNPVPALLAWVTLIAVVVGAFITARIFGEQLPDWAFAIFILGIAAAVALDLYAAWPLHDIGRVSTAAIAAGTALLIVITLRTTRDIVILTGALALVLVLAMILNTTWTVGSVEPQVTALAFAVLPPVIGIVIVTGFRRLVQVELDRVLVQSTVSAPRFAVGMMASEELARLDLAAEELLDAVAMGKTKLPLEPKASSVAASLATELRLHLIEGRRETWLFHAITESDLLGKSVTLTDRASLAGLLDPQQRDGLLSAAWLLVSDQSKRGMSRSVDITVGPAADSVDVPGGRKITIPILIATSGVQRNRVDPSTWDSIRKIGEYLDTTENASLRVDIVCLVDNPADQ